MIMNAEPGSWSEDKLRHMQEQLTGVFADDSWPMKTIKTKKGEEQCHLHFDFTSPSLKIEFKYAVWFLFERRTWKRERDQRQLRFHLNCLSTWLNHVAPTASSLLERSLDYWEWSLRSYLVETNQLRQSHRQNLRANQEYVEYAFEDRRLGIFRHLYRVIADAYDDREETDKECWDMRKLGLSVNLTQTNFLLNFTAISQPWLRQLIKTFMKYNMAIHSPGDCFQKLVGLRHFSRFLVQCVPDCHPQDIDRALIVTYISALVEQNTSAGRRNKLLVQLRVFLETCAYHLQMQEITKERIIFDEDLVKEPAYTSREIPEEVLVQLRQHVETLPTTVLRMVVILLECGMRINELCLLPLNCLVCDDRHEWYLRFYQSKSHTELVIPLVDEQVIGTIQAQQEEIRAQWGTHCAYLFPSPLSHLRPYKQETFRRNLNEWAVKKNIRDRANRLYRFQAHQFRHTVGMRLLNDDVPLEVISRLLGHVSVRMTERYAHKRAAQVRAELERTYRRRKTVDAQGNIVKGDARANDPEVQMTRKGIRGQTLPIGGCGRLVVLGECSHANKCLTCPMWLTSTDDLPKLKSFYDRALRLKQRATLADNQFVVEQQERIIATLSVRIKSLEVTEMDGTLCVDDLLGQLRRDLIEAESALEEVHENGLVPAAKYLERTIADLKARLVTLEEPA
jgi:integrase/recombinase XerD